jgi:hypothetical protein
MQRPFRRVRAVIGAVVALLGWGLYLGEVLVPSEVPQYAGGSPPLLALERHIRSVFLKTDPAVKRPFAEAVVYRDLSDLIHAWRHEAPLSEIRLEGWLFRLGDVAEPNSGILVASDTFVAERRSKRVGIFAIRSGYSAD